jgi:hypothetical protein
VTQLCICHMGPCCVYLKHRSRRLLEAKAAAHCSVEVRQTHPEMVGHPCQPGHMAHRPGTRRKASIRPSSYRPSAYNADELWRSIESLIPSLRHDDERRQRKTNAAAHRSCTVAFAKSFATKCLVLNSTLTTHHAAKRHFKLPGMLEHLDPPQAAPGG